HAGEGEDERGDGQGPRLAPAVGPPADERTRERLCRSQHRQGETSDRGGDGWVDLGGGGRQEVTERGKAHGRDTDEQPGDGRQLPGGNHRGGGLFDLGGFVGGLGDLL